MVAEPTLSDLQKNVLDHAATEPPFTGKLIDNKGDGMYHCVRCGSVLFSSQTKFDSGSGWPSFSTSNTPDSVTLHEDDSLGVHRTEVRCAKCNGHLGHVFDDGPSQQGGKRYCINSCVLDFNHSK